MHALEILKFHVLVHNPPEPPPHHPKNLNKVKVHGHIPVFRLASPIYALTASAHSAGASASASASMTEVHVNDGRTSTPV